MTPSSLRPIAWLAAAVAGPAIALVPLSAAHAADNVICVGAPVGVTCSTTAATIPAALQAANNNGLADTIRIGPGTYTDGPYSANGGTEGLTLQGSGDTTVLVMPATAGAQAAFVDAAKATVRDLKISMDNADSTGDWGISVFQTVVDNVTVEGAITMSALAFLATDSNLNNVRVQFPANFGRGINIIGDVQVSDAVISAATGVQGGQLSGIQRMTRSRITSSSRGIIVAEGDFTVDNTLIDLGTSGGAGLRAGTAETGQSAAFITADHVTIVGGGPGSRGAYAEAGAATGKHTATIQLSNSVIHGPATSIETWATNDGEQGGDSEAVVPVSYSDYDAQTVVETIGANGTGGVLEGAGNIDADPLFVDAATGNYLPGPGSPVIDAGNPAAGTSTTDLVGHARVRDGNGDITAIRDLGALEVPDTFATQTAITGGPTSPTRDRTPSFTFGSEPGATFSCRIDAKPAVGCTSPYTAPSLTDGTHTLKVTAIDTASNPDPTPAQRTFVVDTVAPNTRFTSKPASVVRTAKVRFRFTATGAIRYQCRLDGRAWRACTSPRVVTVTRGKHVFAVRGIDRAGNIDPTPARYRFRRA